VSACYPRFGTPEAKTGLGRAVVLAALKLCAGVATTGEPDDRYLGPGHTRLHSSDFRGTTPGDALNGQGYRAWTGASAAGVSPRGGSAWLLGAAPRAGAHAGPERLVTGDPASPD